MLKSISLKIIPSVIAVLLLVTIGFFSATSALNVSAWVANALWFTIAALGFSTAAASTAAAAIFGAGAGFVLVGAISYASRKFTKSQFIAW